MNRQGHSSTNHQETINPVSPAALSSAQCPHVAARYELVVNYCLSPAEKAFIQALGALHVTLGRSPALSEVQAALSNHPLGTRSRDRFRQIIHNVNARLPDPQLRVHLTPDRPFFRFREIVKQTVLSWRKEHDQSPTRSELIAALSERGVTLSKTSLNNILQDLREKAPQSGRQEYSISRRRIAATWTDISAAYQDVRKALEREGVKRLPCAQDLSRALRRKGFRFSARALQFRMRNCPESLGITLAPYSDPARDVLRDCHAKCGKELGRPPTLREITRAYNQKTNKKSSPDAIWAKIKRLNTRDKGKRRLQLSDTRQSGIYDSDIREAITGLTQEKGRAPTFTELRRQLLSNNPLGWIREDSLHRRLSRMDARLTHENKLKSQEQVALIDAIRHLSSLLGRKPLKQEVLQELKTRKEPISGSDISRILATVKRRQTPEFRRSVSLAIPHHLLEQLRGAFEDFYKRTKTFPASAELAKRLGWTQEGVVSALPFAQLRSALRQRAPVIISDSVVGETLDHMQGALSAVLGRVDASANKGMTRSPEQPHSLQELLHDWELPPIPRDPTSRELSIDESVLRLELTWIHLVCMQAPKQTPPEELEFEARKQEAALKKIFPSGNSTSAPFQGMVHALLIAQFAGRLSADRTKELITSALKSSDMGTTWRTLRVEIQELARQCGFPSLSSPLRVEASQREP